jgi:hypothetical protein
MWPGNHKNGIEEVASWFYCDKRGVSTVRVPPSKTIGKNYAWRSFYHGGPRDFEREWERPEPGQALDATKLSAVFRSQANNQWIVAVACPVYEKPPRDGEFLGVVALTVRAGRFVELERGKEFQKFQYTMLVDQRDGDHTGIILQHPLLNDLQDKLGNELLDEYRLPFEELPTTLAKGRAFQDPFAQLAAKLGIDVEDEQDVWIPRTSSWLAQATKVLARGEEVGWWVVVPEAYDTHDGTIVWTLDGLKSELILYGVAALGMVLLVVLGLWGFSIRLLKETSPARLPASGADVTERATSSVTPDAPTEPHRGGPGPAN